MHSWNESVVNSNTTLYRSDNNVEEVRITQVQGASPPVTGTFQLVYTDENNKTATSQEVPVNISPQELKQVLEADFPG